MMSGPSQIAHELGIHSLVSNGFRDQKIILLLCKLDSLVKGLGYGPPSQPSTPVSKTAQCQSEKGNIDHYA